MEASFDRSKIIEKIKAILSKADPTRNDSEAEVQAALNMAQKMALKHGLDLDVISAEGKLDEEAEDRPFKQETKSAPTWVALIVNVVCNNHRVKCYRRSYGRGYSELRLVGLPRDLDVAEVICRYAVGTCAVLFKKWLESERRHRDISRSQALALRNDYVDGFVRGISQSYAKNVSETGLVPVAPTKTIEKYESLHLVKGRPDSRTRSGDMGAYMQGREDGINMNARKKLGGT